MDTWWEERSLAQKILLGIGFAVAGLAFLALLGWVVMLLWNWLMPAVFGLPPLTYGQAWGILVLSWILFKPWGMGSSDRGSDRRRRKHLRRYLEEDQTPPGELPAGAGQG